MNFIQSIPVLIKSCNRTPLFSYHSIVLNYEMSNICLLVHNRTGHVNINQLFGSGIFWLYQVIIDLLLHEMSRENGKRHDGNWILKAAWQGKRSTEASSWITVNIEPGLYTYQHVMLVPSGRAFGLLHVVILRTFITVYSQGKLTTTVLRNYCV